ncbi:MBG domain-containing protein [Pseudomonas aeruginosa]|uniref:MBG domain-containing protein n=2 Tax=Pseudomonas TaxID=286 RepID=UPI0039799543
MVRPDSQRGKRTSSKAGREGRFVLAASSTLMFAIASINAAMAAPTGAQFNPNEIKISQQGKTTLIDQSTQRAIINWKGFDVSADEAVRFNQPGVTSSTLNRVTAGQESVIAGRISAPGQVIIYNSNGVVFSGSAKVDVGSLITTTANISDEHFRQGKLIFDQPGNPDARIVNDGSISVAEKGLAAFVAPSVANNGVINARLGTVAMAAGNAATIDLYGDGLVSIAVTDPVTRKPQDAQALVSNGGAIQADGGSVLITAEQASRVVDNAVNLSGVILARGTEVREGSVALVSKSGDIQVAGKIDVSGPKSGGDVLVSGQQVALASTASIDARGAAQGGSVRIGGDFQGRGELPRAKNATLAKGASIDVSATGKGNGGLAVVWSDGNTRMDGRILARGGAQGGNGGLVETSGKVNLSIADSAYVSVAAPYGNGGTWLLDPTTLRIVASGGTSGSVGGANGASGDATVNASVVTGALAGGKVTLSASDRLSVEAPLITSNLGGASRGLELIATGPAGAVDISAPILFRNGSLAIRAGGNISFLSGGTPQTSGIVDLGSGTLWMQTSTAGKISQQAGTALIAANLAGRAGSIDLASWDNYAGNLALQTFNGTLKYRQSNATGVTTSGTVFDPFINQSMTGTAQNIVSSVGTRILEANSVGTTGNYTLTADGNSEFDRLVFTALPYRRVSGSASFPTNDSSDYLVTNLRYQVNGSNVTATPNGGAPSGFTVAAGNGSVTTWTGNWGTSWGVKGFGGVTDELQYDVGTGLTEELIFGLGGKTSRVDTRLDLFMREGAFNSFAERAQVEMFKTTTTAGDILSRQQTATLTANDATRVYGDVNPTLTATMSGINAIDAYVNSQFNDLYQATASTTATQASNVGQYAITGNANGSEYFSQRYQLVRQDGKLTVTPAQLIVSADAKTKVYGDADPTLTYQVSGLKNSDTAAGVLSGNLGRVAGENVGNYGILQGGLGLNTANYTLSYVGNDLRITPAQLNVIADAKTKVYGDLDPALTYQVSGLKRGDTAGAVLNGGSLSRVAGENVGVYGINQGGLGLVSSNYTLNYQGNNLTITKALLNVIADAKTKVYGDADPALTYQVSGLKNGDTAGAVLNGGSLSRVAGENVGVYGINQGGLGLLSANYDLSYQGNNLTITKALLNVIADARTKVYGDADPSLTYQVSGLKNGDTAGAVLNGGSLSRVAGENVGVYGINQGDLALNSGNYDLSYQGNNLTITKALLNVIADAKTKVYGDADPSLTYQVSGLKNGDTAGSILTGGLNRAAGENVGVYGINQGDLALNSGNYDLSYQGNNLTITKALLNVIADAKTKVYGDADPSLTYQVSGLKNGDTAGAVLNGGSLSRVAGENVGVYGINQGGLGLVSANYDLSYQGNNLTITKALLNVIADAKTKVYGDADPSLTYQVSGLKNGDTAGAVLNGGSLSRVAGENVGVYGINQGGLALNSGNYDLSYQGNNLTITKALLNVIADGKTKVYGDADPSLTYQVSGLKNGDTAGAVLNGGSLSRVAGENVGVYGINQGDLALNSGNYDLSYQGNNLTITKALLNVIADGKTKVYGDADPSLTYQVSGLKNGDTAGAVLNGGSLSRVAGENVGVYGINQGDLALNSGNYDLSYQGNNLTITKALLNVIADAKTKVYGDADPSLTYQVSGLKNGDTAGAVLNGGSLSRVAGENVGVYGINQGDLALNSGNYDLSYQGNNLTITKALLNVIADAKTKVYGDADPSLTYQVSGLKNGDTAGAVLNGGGLVRVSGENVGNYAIQQGGLGLVSGNYDLAYQGNNLTITKALLNVIADAKTKVYGDADPSLTYQVSGLKNGDSAGSILTGGLNRAAGENVGVYGINQGDLALNSGNYDLSYQGNNLTITKALLNVIADAKTKVYGDADPSLTYQVSGLKNGDSAGSILTGGLNRAAGENVGVYGINQGDLALNSGNYDLSYQGNNLTITKALLNVIADGKTKVYGDADPSLTYQVSGLKNGDTAGAVLNSGSLSRVAGENVGVYGINQGGLGLVSGNYDLAYQGNNLTITKALLNVIADGKTKVYGDADPSLTYQVSGLRNGDSAGSILTGGLNRDAGENVGVYGINQGGLVLTSGNYDLAYQGNDLTITKALLNVFADAKSKQVGTADPALTYQVSGLKNGDSAGQVLAGGLGRVGGEAVGQYDILQGGLALTSGNYQLNYQGNLLSILPLPVTPGDLGQLAALSDLRELQKGRDPDTPGDAVYRTTTLENPFLENPFLRAYALGMDVSDPNLLPATAAGPAKDASAKRVGQFTDRPLRAEAESGAGCSNQSYLADYWSCFNKPLNF